MSHSYYITFSQTFQVFKRDKKEEFLILAPWRVLVLIQVGVASLRRSQAHALKTKRPAQTKRNIGKERAAALDRLPTRPLFLLPMKSCVVKTFVVVLSLF